MNLEKAGYLHAPHIDGADPWNWNPGFNFAELRKNRFPQTTAIGLPILATNTIAEHNVPHSEPSETHDPEPPQENPPIKNMTHLLIAVGIIAAAFLLKAE